MNLLQTIRAIEKTAALQPNVGTVVRNDIFRLNSSPVVRYGAVAWLQNEHTTNADTGIITYNFTLFYVDRLTANHSNEIDIQSQGIETLENILASLPDLGLYPSDYSFRTFNQRFADECAGVFCNVSIEAAKDSICAEAFAFIENEGAYNLDYNEDYHVFEWKTQDRTVFII